jgi:two-component system NarL family sensor kinase
MTTHVAASVPRRRAAALVAVGLAALVLAELIAEAVAALSAGTSFAGAVSGFMVTNGAMGLTFAACGLLLAWHRPRYPLGWLFLAAGVGSSTSASTAALTYLGVAQDWPDAVLRTFGALFIYSWPFSIGLFLPLALLLFPDGRPASPRWRWVVWAAGAEGLLFVASSADPSPLTISGRMLHPYLSIPHYATFAPLWAVGNIGWAVILVAVITSLVIRYRRGGDTERRQLLWLLLVGLAVLAYGGVLWGILGTGPILGLFVIALIPVAVTVAVLRYRLLDIRLVVSRTLLYGLLTVAAAGAYIGLVALIDALVRTRVSLDGAVAASIVVAIGFNPARARLQRFIDRGLYGDRRDPVRAVSRVGERLAGAGASGAGLTGVLEALCESLRLPFAAARHGTTEVAAYGTPPAQLYTVGLSHGGSRIGELIVGLRAGQRQLSPPDRAVLELLAGPLAVALHATALSAALQQSRVSIVAAREEERRRLRRDLHDGLGPALTGIAFKADAARNTLAGQPEMAGDLLVALRGDCSAAIADIRRLVYGLRPPALDDLGLLGSLRQQSDHLLRPGDSEGIAVRLDAPDGLPPLPAAVEVAAYRIITEAMNNAARHSSASRVEVRLAVDGVSGLTIEVADNGQGPADGAASHGALSHGALSHGAGGGWSPGFGLTSMAERAAELGGTCQAGPGQGGGLVTAVLPLDQAAATIRDSEHTAAGAGQIVLAEGVLGDQAGSAPAAVDGAAQEALHPQVR